MMKYYGGAADAIRWELEIEEFVRNERVMGGPPQPVRYAPTEVRLILYDVNKPEAEAIIALVNQMRGRAPEPAASELPPGGRFANLDLE